MDLNDDEVKELNQNLAKNSQALSAAAKLLYDHLLPGTTLKIAWIINPAIVTRDSSTRTAALIISRPTQDMVMTMHVK